MYPAEQIADAIYEYKKNNLANIIHNNCTSFEDLINGTLGNWNTDPVDLKK